MLRNTQSWAVQKGETRRETQRMPDGDRHWTGVSGEQSPGREGAWDTGTEPRESWKGQAGTTAGPRGVTSKSRGHWGGGV